MRKLFIYGLAMLAATAMCFDAAPLLAIVGADKMPADVGPFTITFLTGTFPATITLGIAYTGPDNAALAEYDPGDGTWRTYTDKTITRLGSYIAFRGDWRTSAGTYNSMFRSSFQSFAYKCSASGAFAHYPSHAHAYEHMFSYCYALTVMEDNPVPVLIGKPAVSMYRAMFLGSRLVTKPYPLLDISKLAGSPASDMLRYVFQAATFSSGDLFIPIGINLTNENVGDMLLGAFSGAASWTGYVYWGTNLVTSVITPSIDINTFSGCTEKPNYETLHENWK